MPDLMIVGVMAVAFVVCLVFLVIFFIHLRLWIQARLTGTRISFFDIIGMRLRKSPPELIVGATITLWLRGLRVPVQEVESYYLASAAAGERITSAEQLASFVEALKRNQ